MLKVEILGKMFNVATPYIKKGVQIRGRTKLDLKMSGGGAN